MNDGGVMGDGRARLELLRENAQQALRSQDLARVLLAAGIRGVGA